MVLTGDWTEIDEVGTRAISPDDFHSRKHLRVSRFDGNVRLRACPLTMTKNLLVTARAMPSRGEKTNEIARLIPRGSFHVPQGKTH
jgi:hypothetical protein